MFSLKNKIALVTGAASGIGEAIARLFASAGAYVYVADQNSEKGSAVVANMGSGSGSADFIALDVSDEARCQSVAREVASKHGHIDILVNNAGIGHVGTILTTAAADLDRLYSVNVKGIHHLSQAFLPPMIARKWGSVVNLASIGGIVGVKDRYAYCMTKFAVVGMTKSMALDLADSKVRVNCICPGRVETPFVQQRIREYPDPQKAYEEMAGTQLLKRMAKPEEIAAAALYLAADESAFITGSALIIDGGFSVGK